MLYSIYLPQHSGSTLLGSLKNPKEEQIVELLESLEITHHNGLIGIKHHTYPRIIIVKKNSIGTGKFELREQKKQ